MKTATISQSTVLGLLGSLALCATPSNGIAQSAPAPNESRMGDAGPALDLNEAKRFLFRNLRLGIE